MRIWVVGNGPSLSRTPLDGLAGEQTIGLNRIHLIYPRTKWRPTYYFCTDLTRRGGFSQSQVEAWNADLRTHAGFGYPMFTRDDLWNQRLDEDLKDRVTALPFCVDHFSPLDGSVPPPTAWHMPTFCRYGGSLLSAIQWAATGGFDEIYVVGADLGYREADAQNHFDERYAPVDSYTGEQARWFNRVLAGAHHIAHRECLARGIRIYNATVGGELGAYPRIDILSAIG